MRIEVRLNSKGFYGGWVKGFSSIVLRKIVLLCILTGVISLESRGEKSKV